MSETPTTPPAMDPLNPHSPMIEAVDELLGLTKHTDDMLEKHKDDEVLSPEELEVVRRYEKGLQKMLDLIAPAGMQVKSKDIVINDLVVRTLYAYNWPNYIYPN